MPTPLHRLLIHGVSATAAVSSAVVIGVLTVSPPPSPPATERIAASSERDQGPTGPVVDELTIAPSPALLRRRYRRPLFDKPPEVATAKPKTTTIRPINVQVVGVIIEEDRSYAVVVGPRQGHVLVAVGQSVPGQADVRLASVTRDHIVVEAKGVPVKVSVLPGRFKP